MESITTLSANRIIQHHNKMNHRKILTNIVKEYLNLNDLVVLDDSTMLIDVGADELDIVEIAMGIEDETNIDIFWDGNNDMEYNEMMKLTFGDILKLMERG